MAVGQEILSRTTELLFSIFYHTRISYDSSCVSWESVTSRLGLVQG